MARKPRTPAQRYELTFEHEGIQHRATYTVDGKPPIVTVYSTFGSKATQLGRSPAEDIARMLIHQLVSPMR